MNALDVLRHRIAPFMLTFIALNAVIAVCLAFSMASPHRFEMAAAGMLMALAATLAFMRSRTAATTRCVNAVALALFPAVFLALLQGHGYQEDMHMVFFAYLAVAAAMLDEVAILVAATMIASIISCSHSSHHLSFLWVRLIWDVSCFMR